MAYFDDLSDYWYTEDGFKPGTLNVGWIKVDEPATFPTLSPSNEFLDKLFQFCLIQCVSMRGRHVCELCDDPSTIAERHGRIIRLGSAEIRVFGEAAIYAAPNLVFHFVSEHHYQPPQEFVDAVMSSVAPPSIDYLSLLKAHQLDFIENTDLTKACEHTDQRLIDGWAGMQAEASELLQRKALVKSKNIL